MPEPVCVGDSIVVEVRAVRPIAGVSAEGRVVGGLPTGYVVVATHNGYSRQWSFPATSKGIGDALKHGLEVFGRSVELSERGTLVVDL